MKRGLLLAIVAGLALCATPGSAQAHPLGNFTTNTYSGLQLQPDGVHVDYVVDLAEIPTFQARGQIDTDGDGTAEAPETRRFAQDECGRLADGLRLQLGGRELFARATASTLTFPPGQAGLPTQRLECALLAPSGVAGGEEQLQYDDENFPGRTGWREITAAGGTGASPSRRLTAYPQDRLQAPLAQRSARVTLQPVSPPTASGPGAEIPRTGWQRADRVTEVFTGLVGARDLSPGFGLLAGALALGLGCLHALAPGHGKTLLAAFLVGRHGTRRQAFLLAGTVAVTHTAGVIALGVFVTVFAAVAPERLYPWLGLASGLLFAIVGAQLLVQVLRQHHGHSHEGSHDHHHHRPELRWHNLVAPGLAGGLVPSPSALVVLLAGIALGRAWFGVILVVAYGIGLACALVGAGLLVLRARHGLEARAEQAGWRRVFPAARALPAVSASFILVVGVILSIRAAAAL